MKEIKEVALGVIAMALLLVAADWAVGSWSEMMYRTSKSGPYNKQKYCLNESKEDLLILGSSRASHHYVSKILEDSLGMSCFNAGSDGMCIYYSYSVLSSRIKRCFVPKVVLLEVMPEDCKLSKDHSFTLDGTLEAISPHYGEFDKIDSLFYSKGFLERFKLLSKTYLYNSKLAELLKSHLSFSNATKGFEPLDGVIASIDIPRYTKEDKCVVDRAKVQCLMEFINLCMDNDIKLYFCYSPRLNYKKDASLQYLFDIAKKYNIRVYDYGMDNLYRDSMYFYDGSHLNNLGATRYTKEIATCLKYDLNQSNR